jgi:hypothetical protein
VDTASQESSEDIGALFTHFERAGRLWVKSFHEPNGHLTIRRASQAIGVGFPSTELAKTDLHHALISDRLGSPLEPMDPDVLRARIDSWDAAVTKYPREVRVASSAAKSGESCVTWSLRTQS